jgi:hypothetical protein
VIMMHGFRRSRFRHACNARSSQSCMLQ